MMSGKNSIFWHEDDLAALNGAAPINEKLAVIHNAVRRRFDFIDRIAVAMYDEESGMLSTYICSGDARPLVHYETTLDRAPSLEQIVKKGRPRVVNDLSVFDEGRAPHTLAIKGQGYASSYTTPMYLDGVAEGFLFFNSYQKNRFMEDVLKSLDVFAHLAASVIANEMLAARTLLAALRTSNAIVHHRDPETSGHLNRMAGYCHVIANDLAATGKHDFDDKFIEDVFLFAPMHDIGKIGIPDSVLKKRGKLTEKEFELMKKHTTKGRQIIDAMIENFNLGSFLNIDVLRNIAESHHEAMDGSGYPRGAKGDEIPIEARIIAVADVFDALTSHRVYKQAWTNDEAFASLRRLAKSKLDRDCVEALERSRKTVERLQARFGKD